MPKKEDKTSWGGVADWYDELLEDNKDSYQNQVILPNLIRVLEIKEGEKVLDLACGQGFFSRALEIEGGDVVGADIAKELIAKAKDSSLKTISYYVTSAHKLDFAKDESFDLVVCILALQNMTNLRDVIAEVKRVLKPSGRFVFVINHPVFRNPQVTHWGFDEKENIQYRRVDSYLSASQNTIVMHPGEKNSEKTVSVHHSLQDYMKILRSNSFAITRLEEWISHKKSQKGPRQKAEDTARKEIPLFLMIEVRRL